ncbi:MT-A70 family methyltransferase [Nostoc sp. NIES-3756]|nr:MT-A70 family methyltransferase [Nostoc sp. NIES-3756]
MEKLCPDMTKLEMFARESREGWDFWGDQADMFDQPVEQSQQNTLLSA